MRATVITDASFCNATKKAGWAAWIVIAGVRHKKYGAFKNKVDRSDLSELYAAWNGIFIARQLGATSILLQTDCEAAIQLLSGGVSDRQKRYMKRLRKKKHLDMSGVIFKHVKGHTDKDDARSYVNRWCDEMAKAAMREVRG